VTQWNVTTDIDWNYDVRFGEPHLKVGIR